MKPMTETPTQTRTFTVPVDLSGTVGGVDFEFEAGEHEVAVGSDDHVLLEYLELGGHLKDPAPVVVPLDKLKKDELVAAAADLGLEVVPGATKADLVAAIEAAGSGAADPQGDESTTTKE